MVSGTPTGPPATYQFILQVTDSEGVPVSTGEIFTLIVVSPLTIQDVTPPPATLGDSYGLSWARTAEKAPYTWSIIAGSLPNGLVMDSQGLIGGTPLGATPGPYTFTVQVADSTVARRTPRP